MREKNGWGQHEDDVRVVKGRAFVWKVREGATSPEQWMFSMKETTGSSWHEL